MCHFVWGKIPHTVARCFPPYNLQGFVGIVPFCVGKNPPAVCEVIFPYTICEDSSGLRYFVWGKSPLQLRSQFPLYIFHRIYPTASEYIGETESSHSGKPNMTGSSYLASNKISSDSDFAPAQGYGDLLLYHCLIDRNYCVPKPRQYRHCAARQCNTRLLKWH